MIQAKKRKLDPKIIRVDDIVRIDNPEMFIRCGYPLCINDMCEEIEKHFKNVIEDLIYSVSNGDEFVRRDDRENHSDKWGTIRPILHSNDDYGRIYRELAYRRLQGKNFGGNERKVFTEKVESVRGKKARVVGIKFVKTGIRHNGYSGYDYSYGNHDYEPPYLSDEKTHKILQIDLIEPVEYGNWTEGIDNHRIEAIHVTKVHDREAVDRVCGMVAMLDETNKE